MNPLYLHDHTKFWILHCNHAEKSLFRKNWSDDVEEALGDYLCGEVMETVKSLLLKSQLLISAFHGPLAE